jgi:hypothetical protein
MGLINNWIIKRAEKIKAQEKAKRDEEIEKERERLAEYYKIRKNARDIIYNLIRERGEELKKTPCHISEGQTAILNVYRMGRDGDNGWDGGPRSLTNNLKSRPKTPVTVKITKIYTDTSLADEIADKYIDNRSIESLSKLIEEGNLVKDYLNYLRIKRGDSEGSRLGDEMGLYKTAHFETDDEFQPRWGLNTNSFLAYGTEEYRETYNTWARELEIESQMEELDERKKEIEDEKKKLTEKYREIKYRD